MPITGEKHPFTSGNIHIAPRSAGVFALYNARLTALFYGHSTRSIRSRLRQHLSGAGGGCTQLAWAFDWEVTEHAEERVRELLAEHKRLYGQPPKCNGDCRNAAPDATVER